ncbi:hypothetical protein M8C13_14575 [Crossiella sp. SN42]|uniref:hypothetical protein n=1 Tax=Crossiella sp. SN42 TaxID=2944808 RepID=UPI00207D2E1D|nr:hypothetical protein [Crossiella sp. SN42]MCO1576980.1 hypothetical protein [Crossiella sp. SN42]
MNPHGRGAWSHQERARASLLAALLPESQHREGVSRVCIESRAGSDKHDRRTRDRLRRSRRIDAAMRVDHVGKDGDPLLWLPDQIAGFFVAAEFHGEPDAWQLVNKDQLIDVRNLT